MSAPVIGTTLYVPSTMNELKAVLTRHAIPWETWGKNGNRGVSELFVECQRGETFLSFRDGRLNRELKVVCLDLYWHGMKLIERAIIRNGTRMPQKKPVSASEKIKQSDGTVHNALVRLCEEEIYPIIDRQYIDVPRTPHSNPDSEIKESSGYPGLMGRYSYTLYRTRIRNPLYYAHYNYGKEEFIVKDGNKDVIFA